MNEYEKLLEQLINPAVWIAKGEIVPSLLYDFVKAREEILSLLYNRDHAIAGLLAEVAELKKQIGA